MFHDDLIAVAVNDLPSKHRDRSLAAVGYFQQWLIDRVRERGICGTVAAECRAEAQLRQREGDPAWPLFDALAQSWELRETCLGMEPVESEPPPPE